jgi:DNA repair protein SbcC/Rad50
MFISKVELENIKNYDEASYEFEAGVTAISGPNGAGKTTILEAIAYALFDSLPYKKEDFLKRGAKKGSVRVTFVSAVDGREYTIYRDTTNGYYVFDPITKARLVEQKSQVSNWIKEHMGVEPSTDLKTLFTSTIGVPQGTFTVDFAEQPAKKKIGFDKVLRVEEYQNASDEMRAPIKLVESKETELNAEIARLEGEVAALDGLLAERARQEATSKRLKQEIGKAEKEQESVRKELERLDALQRSIERMTGEAALLTSRAEGLEKNRAALSDEVRRCEIAREVMIAATDGYSRHNEATARLAELEPQVIKRDQLKVALSEKERERYRLEASLNSLQERLKQIEDDKKILQGLEPLIKEQGDLEQQRAELQTILTELNLLKYQADDGEIEIRRLRAEFQELKIQIEETEKLKELAESLSVLEDERKRIESEYSEMRVAMERFSLKKKEAGTISARLSKLAAEIKTLDGEVLSASDAEELANSLPQLESDNQSLMEQVTELKLSIARENKILGEVQDGLCPLLSQRCLNMKEGQGLDQFFKLQLGNEQERLTKLEQQRKDNQNRLIVAKNAFQKVAALSAQRTQLARFNQDYEVEGKNLARLNKEIEAIKVSDKGTLLLKEWLEKIDRDLKLAQVAQAKYSALDSLKKRQDRLKIEGKAKSDALNELKTRVAAIDGLREKLLKVDRELLQLDDPRGRSKQLESSLAKEPEIQALLTETLKRNKDIQSLLEGLLKELEAYSILDEQINAARYLRAESAKDYQTYIANQPLANSLEQRTIELQAVKKDLRDYLESLTKLKEAMDEAQAQYDGHLHLQCKEKLEELIHRLATLSSEWSSANVRLKELESEIEKLFEAQRKMQKLNEEKERLVELLNMSDFIRDLLKKAGPFITEAHLQSISIEANQLYREVTGNPMVSLRWDAGYEVVLEEEGHERPFVSLSGGEQMSAALAVRLALLKELSEIRIAFFDEPTTNMDEERRRNLAQQIGRIKDFHQLFVISHDDAFEGFTDRVVNVGNNAR